MNKAKAESEYKTAASTFNSIKGFKDAIYYSAIAKMTGDDSSTYKKAITAFETIIDWKDSRTKIAECEKRIEEIRIAEEKAEEAKAKKKKLIMIISTIVAVIVVFLIVLNTVLIPNSNLKKAMAQLEAGNYDEAYSMLESLGESKTINSSKYGRAMSLVDSGDIEAAYILLSQCSGYKDSDSKLLEIAPSYYKMKLTGAKAGDTIKFGNYYQSNSTEKEEIEWKVLEVKDGKALIISDKALDSVKYNEEYTDVTWETCTLRKWMNNDFLNTAFNAGEQTIIAETKVTADANPKYSTNPGNETTDKVFLLSINEVNKYFTSDDDRMCVPTAYAISNGAYTSSDYSKGGEATCWWWLRSPGYLSDFAALVRGVGDVYVDGGSVYDSNDCVRPALWIEI